MGYNCKFEFPVLDMLQPDGTTEKVAQKVDHVIYSNEFKYDENVTYNGTIDNIPFSELSNILKFEKICQQLASLKDHIDPEYKNQIDDLILKLRYHYTETVDMMDSYEAYTITSMSGKYADYDLRCSTHYSDNYYGDDFNENAICTQEGKESPT